jgi:hypothetical protein
METLFRDIRYGIRSLLKRPGFTAIAVITLALGIGANTAIFSVVNAVLVKPLAYPDSDRLAIMWEKVMMPGSHQFRETSVAYPNFMDWSQQQLLRPGAARHKGRSADRAALRIAMRWSLAQVPTLNEAILFIEPSAHLSDESIEEMNQ